MKKRNFLRSLALLVAIVLTVTCTLSNYNFVNAGTSDDSTTKVTNGTKKELIQYDANNDGWIIFKYTDVYGEPTFDVKYKGKSVKEIQDEGNEIWYKIIHKDNELFTSGYGDFDGDIYIDEYFSKYKDELFVQFVLIQGGRKSIDASDVIELYPDSNSSPSIPSILSTNYNYLETYDLVDGNPNIFKVTVKIDEKLEKIDDLSISKRIYSGGLDYDEIDLDSVHASNLTYEYYNPTYTIDGESYTSEYSIITFDLEIPSECLYKISEAEDYNYSLIPYIFTFNGLVGANSNKPIEHLQFNVMTPGANSTDTKINLIKLTSSSSNIKAEKSIKLTANIQPADATNQKLTWSSSNPDYATVDENGVVTAKTAGAGKTVTITAKATDGSNVEGTFILNIENIPTTPIIPTTPKNVLVQSIKINASSTQVAAGKSISLKASVNSDATNQKVIWSSSNTKYATIDSNGIVTTKPAGAGRTVIITANSTDGSGKVATFKLTINKILVNKIKLKAKKSIKVGKKLKIKLSVNSDATNKAVKWSVNNKKYAKINSKGVLTAKKAGKGKSIKVTAKAKDGSGKKTTIKIKIKK